MGLFSWIAIGLVIGIVAKWLMPGPDAGGFAATIILGLLGALLAGFIGSNVFGLRGISAFDTRSLLIAMGGSIFVLLTYRMMADFAQSQA